MRAAVLLGVGIAPWAASLASRRRAPAQAPAVSPVDRRVGAERRSGGDRRGGTERRRPQNPIVERIGAATGRRVSSGDRRSGSERRLAGRRREEGPVSRPLFSPTEEATP